MKNFNIIYFHKTKEKITFKQHVPYYLNVLFTGIIKWNTVLRTYKKGKNHGIMIRDFDF